MGIQHALSSHKQLALYASPRFWQYGLLAFIARRCSFDNQHRDQGAGAAQTGEGKSQTTKEKDVDTLTFMRTVIMSFVRGMEYGEQTLPTNDLFVYLPVQILPDLVEQQGFKPAEVKGGSGYRPKEEGAEDNPLIVVGVHTKDIVYDRHPRMPTTSWAERAYSSGALDPSEPSRSPSCCNCECALPCGETWQQPEIPQPICQQKKTLPQKTPGRQHGRLDLLSQCRWEWLKRRQTKQTKPQRTRP